jgi:CHASE3 domain sensor protein
MTTPSPETTELTPAELAAQQEAGRRQQTILITAIIFIVLLVAAIITAVYFLMRPETSAENVERIRDVFIIFMALESLLIGVALIVLIVQFASLINLLQNEVRPILNATNETVNHLRGTAEFLGENVVEPVIKLNGYLAGLTRMLELLGVKKK